MTTRKTTKHITPAVAQADAQSEAGERMAKRRAKPVAAGPPAERNHDEELRYRAQRWADLHANPKTRPKMDTQLIGLSEADQRVVILNGQRLRGGLPYKAIQPVVTKGNTNEHTRRNGGGNHQTQKT
jgi:hypothetical protein